MEADNIQVGMTFKNEWEEYTVVSEPEHGTVNVENMIGERETMFVDELIEVAGF
jgi:hypothetical protein